MANKTILLGVILLGFFSSIFHIFSANTAQADSTEPIPISEPLIMVPGTNATQNRFDDLLADMKKTYQDLDVMKITVKTDDSLTVNGALTGNSQHPVIVIAFEDNSEKAVPEQAKWFKTALTYLAANYRFSSYNFLGHSNGGLVITNYLENEADASDPALDRLMTIGTPYNGTSFNDNAKTATFTKPKNTTDQLSRLLADQANILPSFQMMNVYGNTADSYSDGTVPVASVQAGVLLYGNTASYQEKAITDDATHRALPANAEVEALIRSFFYQD
ncbi:MAG: alpha/beta hydrolase [Enterococcaceae bacterium]|jgi:uncharacterized alpha/beta hydrolase family protein|nr:alpha/beta hydrolase [Enterococcaceae bacterium]MCI1919289.1 alpha/beta hydrolase [Enterococcaceae bacterium]